MRNYLTLLQEILETGIDTPNRTGIHTRNIYCKQLQFDLSQGFPLVTTKKTHFKSIAVELLWYLRGDTDTKFLEEHNVTIWREWEGEDGYVGKIYPYQFIRWDRYDPVYFEITHINQIQVLIDTIKKDPHSRRLLVSAWNVSDLDQMALPPCHYSFMVYITGDRLNLQFIMRSSDFFLGAPYNFASYALLTHMLAQVTGYKPGTVTYTANSVHLYHNHFEQAKLQLTRDPLPLPTLKLNPDVKDIFDFRYEDITLENYKSHAAIKADVAI